MNIFDTLSNLGYGELHLGHDAPSGLRALVGIHSTKLGPAIGGSRIRFYETEADAIDDVTRLAQGMAYKAAIARLPHGGGKAVIMAPADLAKWPSRQARDAVQGVRQVRRSSRRPLHHHRRFGHVDVGHGHRAHDDQARSRHLD